MIEIIAGIMIVIGVIMIISSLFISNNLKCAITILIIGVVIMFTGCGLGSLTWECQTECKDRGLVFSHQEYNQCSEELTCYCKQPITQPKPKVVIIE